MTKKTTGRCLAMVLLLTLLAGCAGAEPAKTKDNFAVIRQGGLAAVGDVMYAMLDNAGKTELHAFDREAGERSIVELTAIEKEGEFFVRLDLNNRYLKSDGEALYSTGFGGSGGYYRTDPTQKTFERIGFYQEAVLSDWVHVGGTAYLAMQDADGYGIYAIRTEEMVMHGELPEPLLRREGKGEIGVILEEEGKLMFVEKKPDAAWFDLVRFDPKTGEETLLASDLCSDMAPRIGDTYMVIQYVGEEEGYETYRAEALLIDQNGKQIAKVMDVDGLWRATAAGGRFVLDHMYAEHIEGEHVVYVIDPKDLENIQAALLGEEETNVIIGGDEKYAYFWDQGQTADHSAQLLALDMETMEVVNLFE